MIKVFMNSNAGQGRVEYGFYSNGGSREKLLKKRVMIQLGKGLEC